MGTRFLLSRYSWADINASKNSTTSQHATTRCTSRTSKGEGSTPSISERINSRRVSRASSSKLKLFAITCYYKRPGSLRPRSRIPTNDASVYFSISFAAPFIAPLPTFFAAAPIGPQPSSPFSLFVAVGSFFAAVGLVVPLLGAPLCILVLLTFLAMYLTFLAMYLSLPPFLYREELRCSLCVFLP